MRSIVMKGLVAAGLAAVLSTGVIVGRATADQPHMHTALDALKRARAELDMAMPDKGGHRVAQSRRPNAPSARPARASTTRGSRSSSPVLTGEV